MSPPALDLPQLAPSGDLTGPLGPGALGEICDGLAAGAPRLRDLTTAYIAERLGAVVNAWLSDDSPWTDPAIRETAAATGYSREMVSWSLQELLRRLTPPAMVALVEAELGSREPFSAPRSHGALPCARGAHPPQLLFQVLAGTVPPVAIESIVLALLARAPLLLKTSSSEPHLARAFVRSLREAAPELAEHVAVVTWPGGADELEDLATERATIVSVYGSDGAVDALMRRCRFPTRFLGYGHRVSFGVLGPQDAAIGPASLRRRAEEIALDAAAYDQRGCMSPHVLFVSRAAPWTADEVGKALAEWGFPAAEERMPRGRLSTEVAAGIQQARGVAEFTCRVYESPTALTIVHDETRFVPSPGGRTLHVVPYTTVDDLLTALRPLAGAISVVGLQHATAGRSTLIHALGRLGVRRVTRLGRMQRPLWLRDHDGRPRIGDWVDWTNVEPLY